MTTISTQISRLPQQLVYTRRAFTPGSVSGGGSLPINGEGGGWALDEHLRCEEIVAQVGPKSGHAKFTYVPTDESSWAFQDALKGFSTDDQVKVVIVPPPDRLAKHAKGVLLFEGVLGRPIINMQATSQRADELVTFVAYPFPIALDNPASEHLIRGRWIGNQQTETIATKVAPADPDGVFICEAPGLPATFNWLSRPNRHSKVWLRCAGTCISTSGSGGGGSGGGSGGSGSGSSSGSSSTSGGGGTSDGSSSGSDSGTGDSASGESSSSEDSGSGTSGGGGSSSSSSSGTSGSSGTTGNASGGTSGGTSSSGGGGGGGSGGGGRGLIVPVFTHEDDVNDPAFWTLGTAIASVLGLFLYGPVDGGENGAWKLSRNVDLEPATARALQDACEGVYTTDAASQFFGLDFQLPELSVHGLAVFDALDALCRIGGFVFGIEPDQDTVGDRGYLLTLWRKDLGPRGTLDLDDRGSKYASAEEALKGNNLTGLQLMKDGQEICNEIFGVARCYIEARFELYPMWEPSLIDNSHPMGPGRDNTSTDIDSGLQWTTTVDAPFVDGYWSKHVAGGKDFPDYGQIGRLWGLDCAGGVKGYPDGPYKFPSAPFDFIKHLKLNEPASASGAGGGASGGPSPIQERRSNNVTDPIAWSNRLRHPLPLRSADARAVGREFILEVSEDGGSSGGGTWRWVDVKTTIATGLFCIRLEVDNLALVNSESLFWGSDYYGIVKPEESWWGLIHQKKLFFRLTCCIEADNAFCSNAPRRATSGSQYKRGQMLSSTVEQTWVQPGSNYNTYPPDQWKVFTTWENAWNVGGPEGARIGINPRFDFSRYVARRQDLLEDARYSGMARTFVWDTDRYHLGTRIEKIRGRDYELASNSGTGASYPNVVGIRYLTGATSGGIELTLEDRASVEDRNWR